MGRYQKHSNPSDDDLLYIIDRDGGIGGRPKTKVIEYGDIKTENTGTGIAGESAYQIAIRLGFQGTEQQWLNSLKGIDGNLTLPSTTKTTSQDSDFLVLFDSSGNPYKITKANFLAGLSTGSGSGNTSQDSLFNSVLLLLKPGLADSSKNSKGANIFGNPTIVTDVKKFESGSIYFNDSSAIEYTGSWLNFSENFAIDFWFSTPNSSNLGTLIDFRPDGVNGNYPTLYISDGQLFYYQSSADRASIAIPNDTFLYAGLKRIEEFTEFWLNGQLIGRLETGLYANSSRLLIGSNAFRNTAPTTSFLGYISGFRITNADRDLSQVPTAPYPTS